MSLCRAPNWLQSFSMLVLPVQKGFELRVGGAVAVPLL